METGCTARLTRLQEGQDVEKRPRLGVEVVPGRKLSSEVATAWAELQQSNPDLSSPFFTAGFTQAVAAVRNDVEVAVIREGERIGAILPFQRKDGNVGAPVGGVVSDYQGVIARPGFSCDPLEVLKACGLLCWNFDRLLASQSLFRPYHDFCEPSAVIDLPVGFAAYASERRAAGTEQIKKCANLARRVEREVGPIRFVVHSRDPSLLRQVLRWKSDQYIQSGWRDLFSVSWGRALTERIQATQTINFAGMFSLLYAGKALVAGHLGMRSRTAWHYWFPAYNRQFARYSPGLLLLLKMAEHAEELGLRRIDLGTGMSLYKQRLMTGCVSVAEGSVEQPAWLRLRRKARRRIKAWLGLPPKAMQGCLLAEPLLEWARFDL